MLSIKLVQYLSSRYIQEVMEAFVAYSLYSILSDKKDVNFSKILFMSFFIGLLTLIIEEYDTSYKNIIKNGMLVSVGSQLVKS